MSQVEPTCPLFARKFPLDTAKDVLRTLTSCNSQLGVTGPHSCLPPSQLMASENSEPEAEIRTAVPNSLSAKLKLGWFQGQSKQQLLKQRQRQLPEQQQ